MFSFNQFDFEGLSDSSGSSIDFDSEEGGSVMKQPQFPHFGNLDDLYLDGVSSPFQFSQEEITKLASHQSEYSEPIKPNNSKPHTFPLSSLGILKNYRSRFRQLNRDNKVISPSYDPKSDEVFGRKLSTDAIIRLAGEKFIQSSQRIDDLPPLCHPFSCSFLGLSNEDSGDVELMQYLLASAEKVGQRHFCSASKLLDQCDVFSSNKGNPVQRLVYYFSLALREKIGLEAGSIASKRKNQLFDLDDALMSASLSIISFHQKVPLSSVSQFSGMQAIVENVVGVKKVHVIDLEIRNGMQFTVLMQALASRCECPIEHLKITALGTKSEHKIQETGKRLMSFAQSMNLPFSFNVLMVADMLDLNEDLFELDTDEAVAVYSPFVLSSMIAQPDRLERLIRVIKNSNPCVMVVSEIEANHNSPAFVNRFIETLFFYGAFFDALEDCMGRDDTNRLSSESKYLSPVIRNIVAAEGGERIKRHVNIDVWRAFFSQFGMVEIEPSMSSLYQASLVINKFSCGSSCTLDKNGNCLIVGWKGTPVFSVSTWKFRSEEY